MIQTLSFTLAEAHNKEVYYLLLFINYTFSLSFESMNMNI